MRDAFVQTLDAIAAQDPRVLLMTGDLGFGVLTDFAERRPAQYINVGVAEQNLSGLAAGLAMSGQTVFTYSIGNFPTLRCLEQIRNDICYHDAPVKIVAIGGGFSYGSLGMSHHATEDIAIMRALPRMTVFVPGDLDEAVMATQAAYDAPGPCYLRLDKSSAPKTAGSESQIIAGQPRKLRDGSDVVMFGAGGILEEALAAAESLAADGVSCAVYSVHTIKPLDGSMVARLAAQARVVVTVEEHTLDGGLGSVLLECCAGEGVWPRRLLRFGMRDEYSSIVGSQRFLRRHYGLSAEALANGVRAALAEKTNTD